MIIKPGFELVEIADEHLAVPVGDNAQTYKGVVALSEAAFYLLKNLNVQQTKESLLALLTSEYEVESSVATSDLDTLLSTLVELGLIEE